VSGHEVRTHRPHPWATQVGSPNSCRQWLAAAFRPCGEPAHELMSLGHPSSIAESGRTGISKRASCVKRDTKIWPSETGHLNPTSLGLNNISGTGANTVDGKTEAKGPGSLIYEPFGLVERSHRFAGSQANSGHRDDSRLSCAVGQMQPGSSGRTKQAFLRGVGHGAASLPFCGRVRGVRPQRPAHLAVWLPASHMTVSQPGGSDPGA
jgi:hypothetical protein